MILARLFSECPLWHRTSDRLRCHVDQRIVYLCPLCLREVSEALKDQPRSEPRDPMTAKVVPWFERKTG